jgi:hypothetical protein
VKSPPARERTKTKSENEREERIAAHKRKKREITFLWSERKQNHQNCGRFAPRSCAKRTMESPTAPRHHHLPHNNHNISHNTAHGCEFIEFILINATPQNNN